MLKFERPTTTLPATEMIRSYVRWKKLSGLSGEQIAQKYGTDIRNGLANSRKGARLLVSAHNEVDNLPRLLFALRHQNIEVTLVDNASTDGTADIAIELGVNKLNIVREQRKGLAYGLSAGLRHINNSPTISRLFITDADSFPPGGYIEHMIKYGESRINENGGIVNGPAIFTSSSTLGLIRTFIHYAKHIYYLSREYVNAVGANTFIQFDRHRRIIASLADSFDPTIKRGTDEMIQDIIVSSGGSSLYTWAPVFTSGSRYKSFASIVDAFLQPESAKAYDQWCGKRVYRSSRRPYIFRY